MLNVEKQLGFRPKELEGLVELPEALSYVWWWFWRLSNSRSYGMSSPQPISFVEMKAFFDLLDVKPKEFELSLIQQIDGLYLSAEAKRINNEMKQK